MHRPAGIEVHSRTSLANAPAYLYVKPPKPAKEGRSAQSRTPKANRFARLQSADVLINQPIPGADLYTAVTG